MPKYTQIINQFWWCILISLCLEPCCCCCSLVPTTLISSSVFTFSLTSGICCFFFFASITPSCLVSFCHTESTYKHSLSFLHLCTLYPFAILSSIPNFTPFQFHHCFSYPFSCSPPLCLEQILFSFHFLRSLLSFPTHHPLLLPLRLPSYSFSLVITILPITIFPS